MRLTYLVMHAELEGLICSGAMRGKQHTYALLDERAPAAKALARDEALAVWVPGRDPKKFPVCPTCQEIYEGLRPPADGED